MIAKTKTRKVKRAVQAPKKRNKGYCGGKPHGMNYADMLQWQAELKQKTEEFAKNDLQRVVADRQAQRTVWLYLVALNERFGFGAERTAELENEAAELAREYAQMVKDNDQDYADEKLRERVSAVYGHEVKYLYEDQYPVNTDRKCTDNAFAKMREAESRIY